MTNMRISSTNTNALKLKKTQNELAKIYLKEQTEYIQNQLHKIRDLVEDRQSRIALQTVIEVSRRTSTVKAKLKATSQEERIQIRKQQASIYSETLRKLYMNQSRGLLVKK